VNLRKADMEHASFDDVGLIQHVQASVVILERATVRFRPSGQHSVVELLAFGSELPRV
jgi:hypothetical protein